MALFVSRTPAAPPPPPRRVLRSHDPAFRMRVDVVVPTVRARADGIAQAVALDVPAAFSGLRFLIVVDGAHSDAAIAPLRELLAARPGCELLSTQPSRRVPAGASAARNVGFAASDADWVLFLDDDTTPSPDLLHQYAEAAEAWLGDPDAPEPYGFAGCTEFFAPAGSLWAVAARCSGMLEGFTAAGRYTCPPWSPTANLMLRRAAAPPPRGPDAAEPPPSGGERARLLGDGAAAAAADDEEAAGGAAPSCCRFDETLPRSGGAEDVDICLRLSVRGADPQFSTGADGVTRPNAARVLVGVPAARTQHRLWSARGILARGLRWGYAGALIAAKHPQLARRRAPTVVEALLASALAAAALARGGHPAAAAAAAALILVVCHVGLRLAALPMKMRLAAYAPPNLRVSLDEPALAANFGRSETARWLGLCALHAAGPSFWLGLSFEVGMLAAVLERPCARAAQLGRWWDFSFGADPQLPPSEVRRNTFVTAAVAAVSAAGGVAWAAWLE